MFNKASIDLQTSFNKSNRLMSIHPTTLLTIVLVSILLFIIGHLLVADFNQPLNVPDTVIVVARLSDTTATSTATATVSPYAISWVSQLVPLPTADANATPDPYCVDPNATPTSLATPDPAKAQLCSTQYAYLPPDDVQQQLRQDYENVWNDYALIPAEQKIQVYDTYNYVADGATPTTIPVTGDIKKRNAGVGGYDHATYTLIGCRSDGSVCEVQYLIEHGYIFDFVNGQRTNVRYLPSNDQFLVTALMKWDTRDGRWKWVYEDTVRIQTVYVTATAHP